MALGRFAAGAASFSAFVSGCYLGNNPPDQDLNDGVILRSSSGVFFFAPSTKCEQH